MFETPKIESIDIDTPEDWDFATAIAHYFEDRT
jgi:CMP-N-acetylneuraminic acid synthetase